MGLLDKLMPPGKVDIILDKYSFNYGDKVAGRVILTAKKPIHATGLKVKIQATERINQYGAKNSSTVRVAFRFEQPVDGEKDYTGGEYPFEMLLPAQNPGMQSGLSGNVETAVNVVKALQGSFSSKSLSWSIGAELNIPNSNDLGKSVQINVV